MRPWWIAGAVLLTAVLFGCDDRKRSETRALAARVEAIDPSAEVDVLREQVGGLEQLTLKTERVREVRKRCMEAYGALVTATEQQEAAGAVAQAVGEVGSGKELSDEDAERIVRALDRSDEALAALARSNEALTEARELLPRCHDGVAGLQSRYDRGR